MKVCAIMATCGRHRCCERSLKFFLDQDHENKYIIVYQNSAVCQSLGQFEGSDKVLLVNNHTDLQTNKPYTNLGAIYRDAIKYIPSDTDLIIFWDDDDIFVQDHISRGVGGINKYARKAYKPSHSYFRYGNTVQLAQNTLEPSIFTRAEVIKENGFHELTSNQHLKWVDWLVQNGEVYSDPEGKPTMCYNWGDDFPTFKTSGDPNNVNNFNNYRTYSTDHGDFIIDPISDEEVKPFYDLFK